MSICIARRKREGGQTCDAHGGQILYEAGDLVPVHAATLDVPFERLHLRTRRIAKSVPATHTPPATQTIKMLGREDIEGKPL